MYRTAFSDKTCPELIQNCVYREQDSPESQHEFRVVRGMCMVLVEGYRVRDFHGHSPDFHVDAGRFQHLDELLVEVSHRASPQGKRLNAPVSLFQYKLVLQKIKSQLECLLAIWDAQRAQAA